MDVTKPAKYGLWTHNINYWIHMSFSFHLVLSFMKAVELKYLLQY